MAQEVINLPDNVRRMPHNSDGASNEFGDTYYEALRKIKANFDEIYTLLAGITAPELGFIDGVTAGTAAASKALVLDASKGVTGFRHTSALELHAQPAPQTATDTATLSAAQVNGGILLGTPTAAAAYTLPLGADLETALLALYPGLANDDAFDLVVVNLATNATFTITMTTNTGWTLVGGMVVEAKDNDQALAHARFRVRRTAANTYTLYRIG